MSRKVQDCENAAKTHRSKVAHPFLLFADDHHLRDAGAKPLALHCMRVDAYAQQQPN